MPATAVHAADAPIVVWFRQDLRLRDNPALTAAAGRPIVALFVLDDETPGRWRWGGASRWWLHHSLAALGQAIAARGGTLTLRRGRAAEVVTAVARETNAAGVFWNRCYEPFAVERDRALKSALIAQGLLAQSFNANLLYEPWTVASGSGEPYRVFSPFWRAARTTAYAFPESPPPTQLKGPSVPGEPLASWGLTPTKPDWASHFGEVWTPGEIGAQTRLERFADEALSGYAVRRDQPAGATTSRLSPHLHWGEIAPGRIARTIEDRVAEGAGAKDAEKFIAELGWREFSHHLLFKAPDLPETNFQAKFDAFPWRDDGDALKAWRRGVTGYPLVDAGMRELWATGWMHNRVRMVAASFLIKHLMLDWRLGQDWFWDTLVDADLANNAASWQWVAGSGADAAPYFRIFNPISQGEKFDAAGAYVRAWIPELRDLPDDELFAPWTASASQLAAAGVRLGRDYPQPIVEHAAARERALAAFQTLKSA